MLVFIVALNLSLYAQGSIRKVEYEGHFIADRRSHVDFTLLDRTGDKPRVRFVARDLRVFCEGGEVARINLRPINARVTGEKTFEGERYITGETQQVFYQVRGRVSKHGRATGSVLYINDLYNLEEPVATTPPVECNTQGRTPWNAQRK